MKKKLSLIMVVIMIAAMFTVFAMPTSAKAAGAQAPYEAYQMLLGKDVSHRFAAALEPLDWSENLDLAYTKNKGTIVLGWNSAVGYQYPDIRIQTLYIAEDAVIPEGTKISVNWVLKSDLSGLICLNYDVNAGVLSSTDETGFTVIDFSKPVPEASRRGYIQFITTITDADGIYTEKTYANGELVFQRHSVAETASLFSTGFKYLVGNSSTAAWNDVGNENVVTINMLAWNNKAATESLVTGCYNAFARYYDKDVKWYPQDVAKNGLVIAANGVRNYKDGVMRTGWVSGRYFMKETGIMVTEAMEIGGVPYAPTYDTSAVYDGGVQRSHFLGKLKAVDGPYGDFYFLNKEKVKGWLDDTHYYYLETGVKCTTSRTIGGVYYEYDASTDTLNKQNGMIEEDGDIFYLVDGVKQGGWQNIDGEWYYFYKESKAMIYDATVTVGGVERVFDENGVCASYTGE